VPSDAPVLAIDAAGSACSAAVGSGRRVLAHRRAEMRHGHAEALLPLIDATMREAGVAAAALQAVAVSTGPGGFTGIRTGLAAATGIALAAPAALIGVTSFAAVAAAVGPGPQPLLVALDSRRREFYVQVYEPGGTPRGEAEAVAPETLAARVTGPLRVAGDAAEAAVAALAGCAGVTPVPGSAPDALGVLAAARDHDCASPDPVYLRPPDVTLPAARPRILPLALGAAEPLAALHRACFPDEPWDAGALARVLSLSGCFGHVAWHGAAPRGFVLARDLGNECEILSLGVTPDYRRRGLGGRLLAAAIAEAGRQGAGSVVLEVATDNQAARRLYARLGFVQVGHRPRYYRRRDGLADALIMRRALTDSTASC